MVVGAFPAAKLGALLIKQISKPIANALRSRAKNSYFFRTYVCMPPAQFYHWCEVQMKMWILNMGKPTNIPKLNESQAIELGANLLGEGLIFVVAAGALVFEYQRGTKKEKQKEDAQEERLQNMQNQLMELQFSADEQATRTRELTRLLYALDSKLQDLKGLTVHVAGNEPARGILSRTLQDMDILLKGVSSK